MRCPYGFYIESRNPSARVEHEANTSKISEDQMFYCMQRGLSSEENTGIANSKCFQNIKFRMEFAVEAQKLIGISLENPG